MNNTEIDMLDDRFQKLLEEIQSCLDEEQEVFVFDHVSPVGTDVHTRTAVIHWDLEEFLVVQSHYAFGEESVPSIVRLPAAAIKFMCADLIERSIVASGFKIGPQHHTAMSFQGWN